MSATNQIDLFDERNQLPTSSVHQSRLQMYQPTKRPKPIERIIETEWGTVTVHGRIGQVHAALMEAFFANAEARKEGEGDLILLVDPHKVRKTLGCGDTNYSHEQVWVMIRDLMQVVLEFKTRPGNGRPGFKAMGHILEDVTESPMTRSNPLTGATRQLWRVRLARLYIEWVGRDIGLFYDVEPIMRLSNGISQAVARHVAGHKHEPNGGWHIDGLIKAAGGGATPRQLQNHRAAIKEDADGLKGLGLHVEDGRLKRMV